MDINNELGPMLDRENEYIANFKYDLAQVNETLAEKAEHDLRMGFRTAEIIKIRISRG